MTLSYKLASPSSQTRTIKIPFSPPLSDDSKIKPHLNALQVEAEKELKIVQPTLRPFKFPIEGITQSIPLITALFYTTFGTGEHAERIRNSIGGHRTMFYVCCVVGVAHTLETLYSTYLCRKYKAGFFNGVCIRPSSSKDMLNCFVVTIYLIDDSSRWAIRLWHEETPSTGLDR